MLSKQSFLLSGKTIQYTWSGDGGGSFMAVVLGQSPKAWADDSGYSEVNCVNSSFGNSWAGSWLATPGKIYKSTVSFTVTGYSSSTVDLSTGNVVETKTGQFDYSQPVYILFRNGDVYMGSAAHLLLRDFRIISGVEITAVKSAQVPGTHKVEITYTLATATPCSISVQVSADGGATYGVAVPPAAFSGDVGPYISAGVRTIVWDAAATTSLNPLFSKQFRFKVVGVSSASDGFALIPAGSFQMGQDGINSPVSSVYVSAFYMGKYEVTKELWDTVRAWGLNNGYTDLAAGNGSYATKGANHPVHSITWYDMVKWCNVRSQKDGLTPCYTVAGATYKTGRSSPDCNWNVSGYRLPSNAEGEKAAHGSVYGKNFPWGTDTISHSQANYYSSTSYAYDVSPTRGHHPSYAVGGYPYSSPVGSFAPNGYGLYDMAGNMWEGCWDWYRGGAPTSQTDPHGSTSGSFRTIRGGSWSEDASYCRVALSVAMDPAAGHYGIGFRIARSSVP